VTEEEEFFGEVLRGDVYPPQLVEEGQFTSSIFRHKACIYDDRVKGTCSISHQIYYRRKKDVISL